MNTYRNAPNGHAVRRDAPVNRGMERIFYNVCILCGTAIIIAITVKVIICLFV